MKLALLTSCFLAITLFAFGQNKTLGIGTPTPNPNAALHVESPGSNQGILIPRLTTVQRTSLSGTLAAGDVGLIVFDTDSRALAIWNGTGWDLGSKVGAPISIDNAAATGTAATLANSDVGNTAPALLVSTAGTGNAIETTGKIQAGQFIGDAAGLTGITGTQVAPDFGSQSITTTGDVNTTNLTATGNVNVNGQTYTWPAAQNGGVLTNNGSGALSWSTVSGTGDLISTNNLSDLTDAAAARTNLGLGPLAELNNISSVDISDNSIEDADISNAAAISGSKINPNFGAQNIVTSGTIAGTFVGDGSGLTNVPSFTLPSQNTLATDAATPSLFSVDYTATGVGAVTIGSFVNQNVNNSAPTVYSENFGGNSAGVFISNNAGSADPTLKAISNTNVTKGEAIVGLQNGTGSGVAILSISNAGNNNPVLKLNTAGSGLALAATGGIQATQFIGDGSLLTNLPSGNGWSRLGNSSTDPATDFLGTTDATDVVFRTNNNPMMRLYATGQVGINTTPVAAQLDVAATATQAIGIHAAVTTASAGQNRGIQADAGGSSAQNIGVYSTGYIDGSNGAIGVYGEAIGSGTSDATGVFAVTNNFTATTGTAYGLYASAEGGSSNWAGFFDKGNVHIRNAISLGTTPGTFGTAGQVLTSQGVGNSPTWTNSGLTLPFSQAISNVAPAFDLSNGGTGNTINANATGSGVVVNAITTGTGYAGYFENTNTANNSRILVGITNSATGGAGGFLINNNSNTNTALTADTNGPGLAFGSATTGTGPSAQIEINNASNASNALKAQTNGTGSAGQFQILNNTSAGVALQASTNGDGSAGDFINTKSTNNTPALSSQHAGVGMAGFFGVTNAGSNAPAVYISHAGTGDGLTSNATLRSVITVTGRIGAQFSVANLSSTDAALIADHTGAGNAIIASTTGTGKAGRFYISNSLNANSALDAETDGTGPTLQLRQTNGGLSIDMVSGGLRISSAPVTVSGATSITNKAGLYELTSGTGTVSLPASGPIGETCWVSNTTGNSVNVEAQAVANNTIRQFIRLTGGWKIVN